MRPHRQQQYEDDSYFVILMAASPVSAKRTRSFTVSARNYDYHVDDQHYIDFNLLVIGQDKAVVESQRPEELPVDLSAELHIRDVDKVSLEYRRWLIEIANWSLEAAGGPQLSKRGEISPASDL